MSSALEDPHDFLSIEDLELASRGIVEGIWQGLRRSPFRGAGVEFESHRDYRPGDDPPGQPREPEARRPTKYGKEKPSGNCVPPCRSGLCCGSGFLVVRVFRCRQT